MTIELAHPGMLWLAVLLPLRWLVVRSSDRGRLLLAHSGTGGAAGGWQGMLVLFLPSALRAGALLCLVLALAHPWRVETVQEASVRGKGMIIAVDISTSMLAEDMEGRRTRLAVAREAATRFADARRLDELGLVAFAGQSLTRVPPTTDPTLVAAGIESLEVQLVLDGTDISAAVLNSLAELGHSARDEKVIVLLTDGAHNGSGVDPLMTARAAAALGVRVHSIALLGQPDLEGASAAVQRAILARQTQMEAEMETVLTALSRMSGGEYFRASTGAALDSIYSRIGELEAPSMEMEDVTVRTSLRAWVLLVALVLVGFHGALRGTRWGPLP